MTTQNKYMMVHYWTEETNPDQWRKWLPSHQWTKAIDNNTIEGLLEDLSKKRIRFSKQ